MTDLLAIEAFGLSGGPLAAVMFVAMVVLLLAYAGVAGARRRRALDALMPGLGFQPIENPDSATLLPDDLFFPNGFKSQEKEGGYGSLVRRAPVAWSGGLGGHEVVVMDVSITRAHPVRPNKTINRTVIRCVPPGDAAPPDFMVHEWVLLKGQARGARAIGGPERIGQHYHVFSDASDEALVPWITPALREQLERHRLWRIAAHNGVLFLSRNTAPQGPGDMAGFLAEGEALLAGLLSKVHHA